MLDGEVFHFLSSERIYFLIKPSVEDGPWEFKIVGELVDYKHAFN